MSALGGWFIAMGIFFGCAEIASAIKTLKK